MIESTEENSNEIFSDDYDEIFNDDDNEGIPSSLNESSKLLPEESQTDSFPLRLGDNITRYNRLIRSLTRLDFPVGSSHLIFSTLWPIIFYTILFTDLFKNLVYTEDNFGTTPFDIFLGVANNEMTDSSQWGGDIVPTPGFIFGGVGLCSVLVTDFILTCIQYYLRYKQNPRWKNPLTQEEYETLCSRLSNRFAPHYAAERLERELLWHVRNSVHKSAPKGEKEFVQFGAEKNELSRTLIYNHLKNLSSTNVRVFSARWRGRKSLYRIISALNKSHLEKLELNRAMRGEYKAIKNSALKTLKKRGNAQCFSLESIHAQYLIWKLGKSRSFKSHFVFGLYYPLYLILWGGATVRYAEVLIQKLITLINFFTERKNCDGLWVYVEEKGNYDCIICDWPFVFLKARYSSDGCVKYLLDSNEDIVEKLSSNGHIKANEITHIDLSTRHIEQLPDQAFANILQQLSLFSSAKVFNISRPVGTRQISDRKSQLLNDFIKKMDFENIVLSHLSLSANQTAVIFSDIKRPYPLQNLLLPGNQLRDDGMQVCAGLAQALDIHVMDVSYNQVTPSGIIHLSSGFPGSHLTTIICQRGGFDQPAFDYFFGNITNSPIQTVIVSDSDLSMVDMTLTSSRMPASHLENIAMANCQLDASQITTLSKGFQSAHVLSVNFNDNYLSEGVAVFFKNIKNSSLLSVSLKNNELESAFFSKILNELPDFGLLYIDVSNNPLSSEILSQFIKHLPRGLQVLIVNNSEINNQNFCEIAQSQSTRTPYLHTVDVSYSKVTDDGCMNYSKTAIHPNLPITALYIDGNQITNRGIIQLANDIPYNSHLKVLGVSNGYYDQTGAKRLIEGMTQKPSLEKIYMDFIHMEGAGSLFAYKLIAPIPGLNEERLTKSRLSIDQYRALARAQSATSFTTISLRNGNLTDSAAIAFCHVLPRTALSPATLFLQGNSIHSVDLNNCASIPSSARLAPFSTFHLNQTDRSSVSSPRLGRVDEAAGWKINTFAFLSPINLLGIFAVSLFIVAIFCRLLSYLAAKYQAYSRPINEDELNELNKNLHSTYKALEAQRFTCLGQTDIFDEKFTHYFDKLSSLQNILSTLPEPIVSSSQLHTIKTDLSTIDSFVMNHAEQNKRYKFFRRQEKLIAEKNQQTGKCVVSFVRHSALSDQLSFEFREVPKEQVKNYIYQPNFFKRSIKAEYSVFDNQSAEQIFQV